MPATSPEAIRRKTAARIAKREAAKAAKALAVLGNPPPVVDVTPVVVDVTPPMTVVPPAPIVDATPVVVPPVLPSPVSDPFRAWLATKQGRTLSTLRGANMQRLDAVYLDRVEAAFRAGYAAGVGDSI
jgi:hypothetical protein